MYPDGADTKMLRDYADFVDQVQELAKPKRWKVAIENINRCGSLHIAISPEPVWGDGSED